MPRAPVLLRMKFIFHNLGIYGFNILVCDIPYLSLWALSKQMTRLSALQIVMSWDAAWHFQYITWHNLMLILCNNKLTLYTLYHERTIFWLNVPSRHNNVESTLKIGCYVEQPKFNVVSTLQFLRWICNVESTLILRSGNNVENSNLVSTLNIQLSQFKGHELLKGGIWNSWARPF